MSRPIQNDPKLARTPNNSTMEPGYVRWRVGASGQTVLVPLQLATQLSEEAQQAELLDAESESSAPAIKPVYVYEPPARRKDALYVETGTLDKIAEANEPAASHQHRVWNQSAVLERIRRHNERAVGDPETRERDAAVLRKLVERGPDMPVRRVDESAMAAVYDDYGHMHSALDAIRADVLVTGTFRPLLVAGPPGIGKTHFARAMAELLGLEFEMLDAASGTNATSLVGLQRTFANSEVGMVFRHLCQSGATANPIVVIDEIDKAQGSGRYRLLDALLPLLETRTSCCMRDLSADLEIDASRISWIALTNSLGGLSQPLLSRFQLVTPSEPTVAQRLHVAKQIAAHVAKAVDLRRVDRDIVVALADRTPRQIQRALQAAANRAVAAGRVAMLPSDVTELGMMERRWH